MASERRLEIFGILIIAISVFLLFSFLGYNPNEEPSISPNVKVENPMGILGVTISHFLIKIGFGYVSVLLPFIGFLWGWSFFAKKDLASVVRVSQYCLIFIFLISVSLGFLLITFSPKSNYLIPGLFGFKLAYFFIDWLSEWGTFIFLLAAYLTIIRAYFNINIYNSFFILSQKLGDRKEKINEFIKNKEIEKVKRKHTLDLKEKIGAKSEQESNLNRLSITKESHTVNDSSKSKISNNIRFFCNA